MNNLQIYKSTITGLACAAVALLMTACGGSDSSNKAAMSTYRVNVINVSNNQPLSPFAFVVHEAGYHGWVVGSAASDGLEVLAEGGDNGPFLQEAEDYGVMQQQSGGGLVLPGASESVDLMVRRKSTLQLSLASMLVNTNDAYVGLNAMDISDMQVDDMMTYSLTTYDAGTEANSELAGTIPGPADGGEGFNIARDDLNRVAYHPGVATVEGNHPTSVLDQSHRFDTPVAMVQITRLK